MKSKPRIVDLALIGLFMVLMADIQPVNAFSLDRNETVRSFALFRRYSNGSHHITKLLKPEPEWHWHPYHRAVYIVDEISHYEGEQNPCEKPPASDDFPKPPFTQEQMLQGAVILYFLGVFYFFTILAIVCGNYFLPSVECICEDLSISRDVAAATFMATATTMPEFFTNTISTFVTESDLGLGAIIGSMLFNVLGVAGCASLAAPNPVLVDWWPVTRDVIFYCINVSLLVSFSWDGHIQWFEAMTFVIMYFIYFGTMFQNQKIMRGVKFVVEDKMNCCTRNAQGMSDQNATEEEKAKGQYAKNVAEASGGVINNAFVNTEKGMGIDQSEESSRVETNDDEDDKPMSLWKVSTESKLMIFWWFYTWPIRLVLTCIIPNPLTKRKLYPLTFILCMIVLALNSYMVVWMVTTIGETFKIPEAVMGLTLLAAGGCLPEAVSGVLMARKGQAGMAVSNSLGSNSLGIMFSLGFPWFIKNMVNLANGEGGFITIYSAGIQYTIMGLAIAALALYAIIALNGYRLNKVLGAMLLGTYVLFVTLAILIELDVILSDLTGGC